MEPTQELLIPEKKAASSDDEIKGFALVEIFGHQRIVGFLSQQAFGTGVLFRVDVPDLTSSGKVIRDGFTRYLVWPRFIASLRFLRMSCANSCRL